MRFFYFLILVAILAPLGIFAYQNQQPLSLRFFDQNYPEQPLPVVLGVVYLLGMVSGSTVVGIIRRSFRRVTESPRS